jgi:hypothetical protein
MNYPLGNHRHLCKNPRKDNSEKLICGCREPKKCKAVLAMKEECKALFSDVKNDLLSAFQ